LHDDIEESEDTEEKVVGNKYLDGNALVILESPGVDDVCELHKDDAADEILEEAEEKESAFDRNSRIF
jgi:hypothetical protein